MERITIKLICSKSQLAHREKLARPLALAADSVALWPIYILLAKSNESSAGRRLWVIVAHHATISMQASESVFRA